MVISAMCEYATCQNLASFYNLSSTAFSQVAIHTDKVAKWLCPFDKVPPFTIYQHGDILFMGYDILVNF